MSGRREFFSKLFGGFLAAVGLKTAHPQSLGRPRLDFSMLDRAWETYSDNSRWHGYIDWSEPQNRPLYNYAVPGIVEHITLRPR